MPSPAAAGTALALCIPLAVTGEHLPEPSRVDQGGCMKTFVGTAALAAFAGMALAAGPSPALAADKAGKAISAGKLAKDAKDFYGKEVTVRAEVEDVLGGNMFTLDEDALLGGADVLVLVPGGLAATLTHDQKVTVQGEVRRYVEADLDRDFDFFEDGKLVEVKTKVDWDTRPVIVARSVRTEAGAELVRGAATRTTRTPDTPAVRRTSMGTPSTVGETLSAGKLARDYRHYFGRTVTVRAEVEDVVGANMFTLDEDAIFAGPDVLVMVPGGVAGTLAHDQMVTVTGEVRPYVEAELDRDFDFFENGKLVQVNREVDWKTRPVIVARSIRTDAGVELLAGAR
jgi:ABC-type Fe3+-hydroxamate transport system substrate-binding protein